MLNKIFAVLGIAGVVVLGAEPLKIDPKPIASIETPNSILKRPPEKGVRFAGPRERYSTCTGVNWFQGSNYLFAISMHTSSVQLYRFDRNKLSFVRNYEDPKGMGLRRPENLDISPDEQWLAIPNMSNGKVQIYGLDSKKFLNPEPVYTIQGRMVHGVRFTPDGKHMAYVQIGPEAKVVFCRIGYDTKGVLRVKKTHVFENPYKGLVPKSIDFSLDGRFAVIGWCVQLKREQGAEDGMIAVFDFDNKHGIIDENPVSKVTGLSSVETLVFAPDSSSFFITDQIHDRILGFPFDQKTGSIGNCWIALQNPEAQLFFPHGLSFSDKYVAVSNYGDDKITVYTYSKTEK